MKPETADYLEKARRCLQNAIKISEAEVFDVAAREAYLAAYHAAEAYIFGQTGKAAKTHHGVRSRFSRLARQEPRIAEEFSAFLRIGYDLKVTADYSIGSAAQTISEADASSAIDTATRFIECITALLI
ncbi:MAG TPA: HEPN domain-containing protein [Stellaceae bacterium]|nr:HEPN domain-containing protein [Stellaceae bacterium]